MKRKLIALIVCLAIFAGWVAFKTSVGKGVFVDAIFCSLIFAAWRIIVGKKDEEDDH